MIEYNNYDEVMLLFIIIFIISAFLCILMILWIIAAKLDLIFVYIIITDIIKGLLLMLVISVILFIVELIRTAEKHFLKKIKNGGE